MDIRQLLSRPRARSIAHHDPIFISAERPLPLVEVSTEWPAITALGDSTRDLVALPTELSDMDATATVIGERLLVPRGKKFSLE